jgi:hypothetical protein
MEDQSERRFDAGVGRETPEDVLVRQDWGLGRSRVSLDVSPALGWE